ncbi:unnamed protein product [Rotaria magnacalcarata]|uniref:UBC core domain-containing protein n=2 Tax=Rotaria magnacalcarata TaxID=392030 RepID=A0A819NL82_9BILA|nr:unnamed protein product [Rotaria magnacalcarata]CAF2253355.1 unnamed protein product [Rotaria magnacalcarata]CAF3901187.1 unnamed protein product [Rotaria magnacalcarata]CAF3999998.1 unnamed protein product [Rotaria magnacalcarata]
MASGSAPGAPSRQTLRIQRNLQELTDNPLPFVYALNLTTGEDNINQMTGVLIGPDDSPYAGGHFRFLIRYPPEYPFKPPDFYFTTAICHPNIDSKTGTTCNDQLNATWAPAITLSKVLVEMRALLERPNYEVPVEGDNLEAMMQTIEDIYEEQIVSQIIDNLNKNYSTELAELVDMTFGSKPEAELQRLSMAEVISVGTFGLRLLCNYHRWEEAEKNDRMFNEHTDATTRIFTIPFPNQPNSKEELFSAIDKMINEAKESYFKGFD